MDKDTEIVESSILTDITESDGLTGSRYKVRLIEGDKLGSTGYYPAEVVRRDGPKIFKAGTPMFIDHATPEERTNKPFGSVAQFVGEIAEDAYYENDGLYANIEVFEHQRPMIKSLKDRIGISIRAVGRSTLQVLNGQSVPVFNELVKARSADFVMRAGAGGKIVDVLESATESEETSELEEGRENMDEVLQAIADLKTDVDTRLTALEEAAKPEEKKEEVTDSFDKALEIAEAFVASSLDATGRQRVLDLHKANGKPLAELIEAEEAYIKKSVEKSEEVLGTEELEESAKEEDLTLPSFWNKGNK